MITVKFNSMYGQNCWGSSVCISTCHGQLRIVYTLFVKYLRKNGNTFKEVRQVFTHFDKTCDYFRRNVLRIIVIGFVIPTKLV